MKRLLSLFISVAVLFACVFVPGIPAAAETIFEDTMQDMTKISEKKGSWDNFPSHNEFSLSVIGRQNTTSENSIVYSFNDKEITSVSVRFVLYHGFFSSNDYEISVYQNNVWSELSAEVSAESDIEGKETSNFKLATVSVRNLSEGISKIKITLKNVVAWTLFIDNIILKLADSQTSGDDNPVLNYVDELGDLKSLTKSEGEWSSFLKHPEFGLSVAGRQNINSDNYLYYMFKDGEISAVDIELVIYSGFFKATDIVLSVRNTDSDTWKELTFESSTESNISGYETVNFKKISLKSKDVPSASKQLRIELKNSVAWTLFIDKVTVTGCSQLQGQEIYKEELLKYTAENGTELEYYLVTPEDYDESKEYPLVFFLHHLGGDKDRTGYEYLKNRLFKNDYDCILLAPLANREKGQWWVGYEELLEDNEETAIYKQDEIIPTSAFEAAKSLLVKTRSDYAVDTSRIYAMGVSMGGYATWEMITRYPEMFTAAVPICGGNDPTKAEKIVDMPIWTFHGEKDTNVAIDATRTMVENLKNLGSTVVKYTEYAGLDHGIWFKVYDEPEMLSWLFDQDRETTITEEEPDNKPDISYVDELENLKAASRNEGDWASYSEHPEFGLSVAGRQNINNDNYLYYMFKDGEISAVNIELVIYSEFFKATDIVLSVRNTDSDTWKELTFELSAESNISGYEAVNFKKITLNAKNIPASAKQLRIQLKNEVAWTLFIDKVTVGGCSNLIKREVYDEQFLKYTDKNGTVLDYYLVTPDDYDESKEYPLVFFLHGVGGETDQSAYTYLRDRLFKNGYDCILLAPLANREKGQWWVGYEELLEDNEETAIYKQDEIIPTSAFEAAKSLLVKTRSDYAVDTSRIYAMGVSMGGYATWEMITRYPEMFTAAVPICGGNDPTKAEKIVDMPIWTFHGDKDLAVSIDATRKMVKNLKKLGSTIVKYTEYAGLDHGIWFKVFDEPKMLSWLFEQDRETTITETTQKATYSELFIDKMENLNYVDSYTDGWDIFNSHTETGLSVIGRKSVDSVSTIYYSFDNKNIAYIKLLLQYAEGISKMSEDLVVEALDATTGKWKKLNIKLIKSSEIGNTVFSSIEAEFQGLPENVAKISITLKNEILWGLFIDEVVLGLNKSNVPVKERVWTVEDGLNDYKYISDNSNNLKLYTPHPETNLNVLSKNNAKVGYITYAFVNNTVKDFEVDLQIANEYFLKERDLLIKYRLKGETEYKTLEVLLGKRTVINNTFSTVKVTPSNKLPSNVEDIKIMMYNDVAWTLMIDCVKLDLENNNIIPVSKKDAADSEEQLKEESDTENEKIDTSTEENPLSEVEDNVATEKNQNFLIWIIVGATALIIIGLGILVIVMTKKNKF